ncbi:MAG: glycosyltransferase family 9 protein [Solidesulfovibrio sp. DCME]|uniref:glycosyltransferase family 9 protein n=1 Tax=Solidesulfovibrio sp. DCME TaxID=3447380 RepID=UPI003D0FAE66
MPPPDKVVLEHAGALGDFLLAWPFFLSLARHFREVPIHQAVPAAHAPFLAPWARPCPPDIRRALDARFAGEAWPTALENTLVVRPGLGKRPPVADSPWFWFAPGLTPGSDISPAEHYRQALDARGIAFAADFAGVFRQHFGGHAPRGDTVLLFPGAGHTDKAWPLGRFEQLAALLRERGLRPVFVIGPVERDRGLDLGESDIVEPQNLEALSRVLCAARFALGPDSGPMHLAGLHGVPGLALFGPTSPRQWGPFGLDVVTAGLACAPCTAVTSGAFAPGCQRPLPCLAGLTAEGILTRLEGLGLVAGRP